MTENSEPLSKFGIQKGDTMLRHCRWGTMMYNRHDTVIGRSLTLYGEFAEDENDLMSQFIRAGDTVVDVGANVGTVTLFLAAAVGSGGRVYAVEPQRDIFYYLCGNVAFNGHRNVICLGAAVGARAGTVEMPAVDYGHEANFGSVSLVGQGPGETEVRTLDGLNLAQCRLIKMDIEGMELDVLEGAEQTVDRCQPFVYTENKKGERSPKLIEYFLDRRYTLYWHFARFYREENFRRSETNVFGEDGDINMVCVPPSSPMKLNLPIVFGPHADWNEDYTAWMGIH